MKNSNNKGLVLSYAVIQFFLMQLFRENLIDIDAYVFTRNLANEEFVKKNESSKGTCVLPQFMRNVKG